MVVTRLFLCLGPSANLRYDIADSLDVGAVVDCRRARRGTPDGTLLTSSRSSGRISHAYPPSVGTRHGTLTSKIDPIACPVILL